MKQQTAPMESAFRRALRRFKAIREERARPVRIGFLIDATQGRTRNWRQVQRIQARMFRSASRLGKPELRLVHFTALALIDHGWMTSSKAVAAAMRKAFLFPLGWSQVVLGLWKLLEDEPPDVIVLVGGRFDEDMRYVVYVAREFAARGIRVFSFLGSDDRMAGVAFRYLASTTGGAFARFGAELPLGDLCEGVALLTAGGHRAIKHLKNETVKHLLLQVKQERTP